MASQRSRPSDSRPVTPGRPIPRKVLPAWLFSVVLHVCLLVTWAALTQFQPRSQGRIDERPVQIARVATLPDRAWFTDQQVVADKSRAVEGKEDHSQPRQQPASAPPSGMQPPIDLDGVLAEMTEGVSAGIQVDGTGDVLRGAQGAMPGRSLLGSGNSPPITVDLFGVSGTGTDFVYVIDRSDSMNEFGRRPFQAAKRELIRSLESLSEHHSFQIIFYNDFPKPFAPPGGGMRMLPADQTMRKRAQQYVENTRAFGGTEHVSALSMALRFRPHVIFFLTDGQQPRLSRNQIRSLTARAAAGGTSISVVEFGTDRAAVSDNWLRALAKDNGGGYRYFDVRGGSIDAPFGTAAP